MIKGIEVVQGDITKQKVDAIVNAANESLLGGGGVYGAIHRTAGNKLLDECKLLNGCATGEAKITGGYNLLANYVIHAVGPVWNEGLTNEDELLASCYRNVYNVAWGKKIESIAFPAISTGVYRYPLQRATEIALDQTIEFMKRNLLKKIIFVCFDNNTFNCYTSRVIQKLS